MFKFKDPRLQNKESQLHDTPQKRNEITLKNGDQLKGVSDVDSILSSDDNIADDVDVESSGNSHAKVISWLILTSNIFNDELILRLITLIGVPYLNEHFL